MDTIIPEKNNTNIPTPILNKEVIEGNYLKVGDITLSGQCDIETLCGYLVWLLQQQEVKEYFEVLKKDRITNGKPYYD